MTQPPFSPDAVRPLFPALQRTRHGRPVIFADGPGGTQVPRAVLDAMSAYLARGNANLADNFDVGRETLETVQAAREALADFLNARSPAEIVFGPNMTTLTFAFSRALARTWQPGDEIVLTRLDHDANIAPWLAAAEERGVVVRWLDFHPADCTLALEQLPDLLTARTRLVAVTYASNAVGSITDVRRVVAAARAVGALVYVDAVHYAPHGPIDVQALGCDVLVSSVYKYFGPHVGVLYGRLELLEQLPAYKVRPAPSQPPGKWETGTQSFESLAGATAAVDYLAQLGGDGPTRRARLTTAWEQLQAHERALSERFLRGATAVPGLRVYGVTDLERLDERTPTFAVSLAGYTPEQVARRLGEAGVYVYHGHYYAVAVMERLGLLERGGLVRIGFVHYNTAAEVDRVLELLAEPAGSAAG